MSAMRSARRAAMLGVAMTVNQIHDPSIATMKGSDPEGWRKKKAKKKVTKRNKRRNRS